MDRKQQILDRIELLNRAARAYYQDAEEIMPNVEYDRLYDELVAWEKETGLVFASSPTQNVGYQVLSELPKERHPGRMLSLDKTKDRTELAAWLGEQEGILSWKLDGLTIVLTYEGGQLVKALTRGNGEIGEVVTQNAKTFVNVPLQIPCNGRVVLRGEAIITYSGFEKINQKISEAEAKYKNPRNLCSGSVRQLDPAVTKSRGVQFIAFALVEAEGQDVPDFGGRRSSQLDWLEQLGFDVVAYRKVTGATLVTQVAEWEEAIKDNDFPSDGLVLCYEDILYGRSLGATAKFPRDAIAFKWADQMEETTLEKIEWSASRTGLINPVAVFAPVELEGTTVSRASVHNLSIVKDLKLGIGDRILVYKANMIIPQIADNFTGSGTVEVPEHCPVCGGPTKVLAENGVETLHCTEVDCPAKQIKSFSLFVSRDAMNIEGLSESTLEKLVDRGLVKTPADLFRLDAVKEDIVTMEGFGEKSFENLLAACETARETTPARLLYALGIPGIGASNARLIEGSCGGDFARMQALSREELLEIKGVGEVMAEHYVAWFKDPRHRAQVEDLLEEVRFRKEGGTGASRFLEGVTFVITGSLVHYENRSALQEKILAAGGKVAGSVSAKTGYLINNDVTSTSGKNKKARELGIPVIDEETIRRWLEKGNIDA